MPNKKGDRKLPGHEIKQAENIHAPGPSQPVAPYDESSPQMLARGSDRNNRTLEVGRYQSKDYIEKKQGWALNAAGGAKNLPNIRSGTSAPSTTPTQIGDIYVKTNTAKIYMATGTSSSADWTILN